jgi:hypothetical protein
MPPQWWMAPLMTARHHTPPTLAEQGEHLVWGLCLPMPSTRTRRR